VGDKSIVSGRGSLRIRCSRFIFSGLPQAGGLPHSKRAHENEERAVPGAEVLPVKLKETLAKAAISGVGYAIGGSAMAFILTRIFGNKAQTPSE